MGWGEAWCWHIFCNDHALLRQLVERSNHRLTSLFPCLPHPTDTTKAKGTKHHTMLFTALMKRSAGLAAASSVRSASRFAMLALGAQRCLSDSSGGGDMGGGGGSITYSGGQATSGQGGFYGAGGARASKAQTAHRPEAVAHAADIKSLRILMEEVDELQVELRAATELPKQISIKSAIKKKASGREMTELLKRLELKGQPVWGMSVSERDLVKEARRLFNSC